MNDQIDAAGPGGAEGAWIQRVAALPLDGPPLLGSSLPDCEPVYETLPGWREPSAGATTYRKLPSAARDYLGRLEDLVGVPVDIVSTGPSRDAIVIRKHPFA